jgi:prepilin-type processing-associated H-X9-DG protein
MYSADNSDLAPQRDWPVNQNIWQTTEACRVDTADGKTINRGPYNMGLLFFSKAVPNAEVFYCPSLAKLDNQHNYGYYSTTAPWPSTSQNPPGSGTYDDNVRTACTYYPQPRERETVSGYEVPVLTYQSGMIFGPGQSALTEPAPLKVAAIDPNLAVSVDFVTTLSSIGHKNSGQPAGLNVLFADSHVKFATIKANSARNQAFDPNVWAQIQSDTPPNLGFRRLMYYFQQ